MRIMLAITILSLAGCAAPPPSDTGSEKGIRMPNPASVHCAEQGGTVEMRQGPEGVTGYCHLPDGRVVEEWELYRAQQGNGGA